MLTLKRMVTIESFHDKQYIQLVWSERNIFRTPTRIKIAKGASAPLSSTHRYVPKLLFKVISGH